MSRIAKICALLERCASFADVGCDHGYCAEYMLKKGLCERAYITDVSAKSLSKAERLLSEYIKKGKCVPICCDGLEGFDILPEQVLIAGMGGEEIISILSKRIPEKFVLQPMKNAELVRGFLIERGCKITYDDLFFDGKYYFIIKGENSGRESYTPEQVAFGRDSFKNPIFKDYLNEEIAKCKTYLLQTSADSGKLQINKRINYFERMLECTRKSY